ncbi:MAG: hypothetical protein HY282_00190 [Nitrospirae bacterium]|nr:hypothetical protein [Candidatus Manganitrophaceae bacterium]
MQAMPDKKESPPSATDRDMEAKVEGVKPAEGPVGPKPVWRPILAALLSLVFAGLGHLFLRQYLRGVLFIFFALSLLGISDYSPRAMMLNIILFVFSAFDAFSFAKRGFGVI